MSRQGLSLVDIAELVLRDVREPLNVYDLYDKVCVEKVVSAEEKAEQVSQFYADITTSAKFVYVGENTWDLKDNQKIELWEKDGSYYKEYTKIDLPDEYLDKPKAKAAKPKKAAAAPVKEVPVEVVAEPVVEEKVEVVEEKVAEVAKPDTKEAKDAKDTKAEDTPAVVTDEYISEEFDDELFDEFDEEKYNEIMDSYEDQYDK